MALTDQVIMPGSDYQAICDATRSLTNTTGVLKSGEIASKILSGKSSLSFRKVTTLQISDGIVTFSSKTRYITVIAQNRYQNQSILTAMIGESSTDTCCQTYDTLLSTSNFVLSYDSTKRTYIYTWNVSASSSSSIWYEGIIDIYAY